MMMFLLLLLGEEEEEETLGSIGAHARDFIFILFLLFPPVTRKEMMNRVLMGF